MQEKASNVSESLKPGNPLRTKRFWDRLDVFSFIPVPIYSPDKVTSKRSYIASLILSGTIFLYALYTLTNFFMNNIPSTSEQEQSIADKVFTMPNITLTVVPDMNKGISIIDQTYYGVNISQGVLYSELSHHRKETLLGTNYSCNVDWLSKMNSTSFICPSQLGNLQGNLFTSDEFHYIKIDFFTCVNRTDSDIICQDEDVIKNMLRQARLFLFIQQDPTYYNTPINAFKALFYYSSFKYNQKYEIYLKSEEVITSPDFFHSFEKKTKQGLFYGHEKTYISELIPGQENLLITIWLRLSEEEIVKRQVPQTMMEVVGKWGALWSTLFGLGALYFLRFNKREFYGKNEHFQNFRYYAQKKE